MLIGNNARISKNLLVSQIINTNLSSLRVKEKAESLTSCCLTHTDVAQSVTLWRVMGNLNFRNTLRTDRLPITDYQLPITNH
jgi:hypothetical protein